MTVNCGKLDSFNGKIPVAKMPMEPIMLSIQYHFLKENTVSTKGAHKKFKTLGRIETATNAAIFSTETPAWDKRKPIVTDTYPDDTP